jgi:uncharacterized protein (DUF1501 family)
MNKGIGTRVFYVTTGGFDTHSAQNVNATNGAYYNLMATLNDALLAFFNDLKNQGLLDDTLLVSFSEFGRRITENGSQGTDHGSASAMMVMGGRVNGGLYGTAPASAPIRATDPREQRRGRQVRNRLPIGLRAGHRRLARRGFGQAAGRQLHSSGRSFSDALRRGLCALVYLCVLVIS